MGLTGRTFKSMLLICLTLLPGIAISQNYRFLTFGSEKELSQPFVYSILQDSHGYLWIGTGSGLSQYNGFEFENYTVNDSLADDFITCGISSGNDLWFGHMNGRISFYHNKNFSKVNAQGRDLSPVTHFARDPKGNIWFSTYEEGLFRLDPHDLGNNSKPFGMHQVIHTFEFVNEHEVLLGTGTGLVFCKLSGSDTLISTTLIRNIPQTKITGIQKKRKGPGYYVSTENDGLFLVTLNKHDFHVSEVIPASDVRIMGIQQILEDSQSDLWIATIGNGLIKISFNGSVDPEMTFFNKSGGFLTDNVKTVFEDREGIIWSGNYGDGLTRIIPSPLTQVKLNKELYGNNVTAVYASGIFQWIGTEKGLLKKDSKTGNILKFYNGRTGIPDDNITAIYSANEKDIWIGTAKTGLFCLDEQKGKIKPYPLGENSMANSITQIKGRDEIVWVGTQKGLCRINTINQGKTWFTINQGGLPHNYINSLFLDKKGTLWVSTNSSTLAYIRDEKVTRIGLSSGKGVLTLGEVTEDAASRIWVGSFGDGVFVIDKDSIANLNSGQGLLSDYCYSVICDDLDNIWIGHRGGISRIRSGDFTIKILQDPSNIPEDCQFNRNAVCQDHGIILFGSDMGLYSYDRMMELPQKKAPVLLVTSIKVNNDEIDPEATDIELIPGSYKIRISFLGISLKDPSLVSYQYKLEGYEQWSEVTRKNEVTYNHLSNGKYKFIIRASDSDGDVTLIPLTVNIVIRKPIWKKWWFYSILVILVYILILTYIKWKLHRLTVEKALLEEKVHIRTNEIECQKNELALQRDMIERKNASITSSILYASQIQNAILPPDEFIDKLLPENFILNLPKDIVSGDFYWLTEKDNKIVFTVADCTGHGVPGSFMSLLGITMIREIVNVFGIVESDEIVTALREKVIESLQQNRKAITTSDGMDIALCVMDRKNDTIQFTGGMNDLIYIHQGKLEVVEADHISVSVLYSDYGKFSKKEIHFEKGDIVYLASDGFQDQFGGKRDKKFLRQRFHSLLTEIHKMPMGVQKEVLEKRLREWMGSTIQTDDITVMGIRL
jgi:ligand-binding sensor domain-containing protein/serine phosphatase RsbU (regulator of sigma subunit)